MSNGPRTEGSNTLSHLSHHGVTNDDDIVNYQNDAEAAALLRTYLASNHNHNSISSEHIVFMKQCLSQLISSTRAETILPMHSLLTMSTPLSYHVGTGRQLLNYIFDSLLRGPKAVKHEILFVTCFWAKSSSLEYLAKTLLELNRLHPLVRGDTRRRKLRIRICISSISPFQKLFHTSSDKGYTFPNSVRAYQKLGLPSPDQLANLDIMIKSKFYRPISVLHGKAVVVDQKRLFLPSCNVSWEEWLEGMGVFEGPIVDSFLQYYQQVWGNKGENPQDMCEIEDDRSIEPSWTPKPLPPLSIHFQTSSLLPTIFLPQPHHSTFPPLRFIPSIISRMVSTCLPFQITPNVVPAPLTPQNVFMASLLRQARCSIFIQTPNLTCPDLLDVLYERLTRSGESLDIKIVTCKKMMFMEQLVTTGFGGPASQKNRSNKGRRWGATTEACINELVRRVNGTISEGSRLHIYYYTPLPLISDSSYSGDAESRFTAQEEMELARQSHVKAMVVDDEVTIVGSANGDRASWFTSGEFNVLVFDKIFAGSVRDLLERGVGSRKEKVIE